MVKARRNLVLVLRANRTVSREHNGAGGSRLTFADVTTGGQAYETPGSVGGEQVHAVGTCAASKPPVLGHADVWEGTTCDSASLQGVQHQLQPCTLTICSQ